MFEGIVMENLVDGWAAAAGAATGGGCREPIDTFTVNLVLMGLGGSSGGMHSSSIMLSHPAEPLGLTEWLAT